MDTSIDEFVATNGQSSKDVQRTGTTGWSRRTQETQAQTKYQVPTASH